MPFFAGRVKTNRVGVDVPMLVLRGKWLKALGFPIGAKAFLSTDTRGDIKLTRMGLKRPRKMRIVKARPRSPNRSQKTRSYVAGVDR